MTVESTTGSAVERRRETDLADVVSTVLDKGVVVDVFARVSLVGIELLRADIRVVIASVDTYLQFADAIGRTDLGAEEPRHLTDVVGDVAQSATEGKTKGVVEAGVDEVRQLVTPEGRKQRRSGGRDTERRR